jgi:subtilisin family serine protease
MKIQHILLIIVLFFSLNSIAYNIGEEGEDYRSFNRGYNEYMHLIGADSNVLGNNTLHDEYYYFYKALYSKIGVFDMGFYFNHEDLINVLKKGTNTVNYHGTLVSGIIAAESGNQKGFRGITQPKYIYGLNYLDKGRSWSDVSKYIKSLCSAFNIFNISLDVANTSYRQSGNNFNMVKHIKNIQKWRVLISSPECNNTMFVFAGGNSNVDAKKDNGAIHYEYNNSITRYKPLDNVIIVSSYKDGIISQNYGNSIDIYAPDFLAGPYKFESGNSTYTKMQSGSSYAAPQVTATVSVVLKSFISMQPKKIKEYILNNHYQETITDVDGNIKPMLNTYQIINKVYNDRH